jgi:predicted nucleic acid-binding protein
MLVLDANVALAAAARDGDFGRLGEQELGAPPLLWPEARSALHVARVRGIVSEELAQRSLAALESGQVRERRHRRLGRETWRIADELGWSKTYDAEYLALASLLDAALVTFDGRMQRAAQRLGLSVDLSWV